MSRVAGLAAGRCHKNSASSLRNIFGDGGCTFRRFVVWMRVEGKDRSGHQANVIRCRLSADGSGSRLSPISRGRRCPPSIHPGVDTSDNVGQRCAAILTGQPLQL